jgi:HEAT repeat protein
MERAIQELKDRVRPERWKSVVTLGTFGEPALEYLHHALGDDDKWVRFFAADALGNIGSRSSVDFLIQTLMDQDQDVRWVTASALGKIGGPRAAHALQQAYNSDNEFVKIFIGEALEKIAVEKITAPGIAISL